MTEAAEYAIGAQVYRSDGACGDSSGRLSTPSSALSPTLS